MTKDSSPAMDPRYDPVYQRGFAGTAASRIRAVEIPKPDRPAQPQRAEPQRPDAPRATALRPGDERVDPFVVPPAKSVPQDELLPESTEPEPREDAATVPGLALRGNPWVASLWVVAVLLLTAGFFGTWRSQSIYVGATPINDMNEIVMFQVLQTLSPSLVLVGLLVLGGLFFLHAVSWRGRRRDEES
jgi:hypothetical protein